MVDDTPEQPLQALQALQPDQPVDESGDITTASPPLGESATDDAAAPAKKKKKRRKRKRPAANPADAPRPAMPPETWWQKLIIRVLVVGVFVLGGLAFKVWIIDRPAQNERNAIITEFHSHADEFRRQAMQSTLEVRGLDQIDTPEKAALFRDSLPRAKQLMISANQHYEQALAYAQAWQQRYDADTPGSSEMASSVKTLQAEYLAFLDTANQLDKAAKMLDSSGAPDSRLPALPDDNSDSQHD